jgi:hypothetical protein
MQTTNNFNLSTARMGQHFRRKVWSEKPNSASPHPHLPVLQRGHVDYEAVLYILLEHALEELVELITAMSKPADGGKPRAFRCFASYSFG